MRFRLTALLLALALLLTGCVLPSAGSGKKQYQASYLTLFDTVTYISGMAESEEAFQAQAREIHDQLLTYHQLFDIYNCYEGLNNLKTVNDNAGITPVEVDGRIIRLLEDCRTYYELTGHKVNAVFGRFVLGREFSVAVIDHYFYIGIDGLYGGADLPYLLGRESTPVLVASGALDENRGNRLISGCKLYGIDIGISVPEIDLSVIYTVKLQRAVAISFNTYCVSQCVIGQSCNRKQRVAGLEHCKKRGRERVCSVYEAYADKRGLRAEHLSIDLIQHFPAQIVIAVSAGARKAGIGHLVILKSRHDLYRVQLGNPVDPFKLRLNLGLDFFCKSIYLGFYI